jgi:hypothetical protein
MSGSTKTTTTMLAMPLCPGAPLSDQPQLRSTHHIFVNEGVEWNINV